MSKTCVRFRTTARYGPWWGWRRCRNRRGQVENLIKELKIGFGMEQMSMGI